ncbi:hypothetical protein ABZ816_36905 [Actinosynnema sp. NPDC047251]|uniref:Guanylate cyclase domain-containing protein n=1 Tax=Saccharothrix espanaensis (strain ATCC 51144 / DSM 44229 / JCM 9112 / NBRC 15066 / NRRL 15764) TaxID=1179773 RepID=K0JR46_SACES|nr:hypothetical protein [Saccharothrix espanaensis]CCH28236.1 hypothetical protein BN6_09070 [Saccharothrix espanaensis DSM 44229]
MNTRLAPSRPLHRTVVVFDIAGYGRRDNRAQVRARAALHTVVRRAFRAAGVPRRRLVTEDRGDGLIVLVPPTVSKVDVLEPLVPLLGAELLGVAERIRLRMAVHAGELVRDPYGWVGADLNTACRLVDSAPLYEAQHATPEADLVVMVSDVVHRAVVRHGYRGIRTTDYRPVRVVCKEVDEPAWVHVPPTALRPSRTT